MTGQRALIAVFALVLGLGVYAGTSYQPTNVAGVYLPVSEFGFIPEAYAKGFRSSSFSSSRGVSVRSFSSRSTSTASRGTSGRSSGGLFGSRRTTTTASTSTARAQTAANQSAARSRARAAEATRRGSASVPPRRPSTALERAGSRVASRQAAQLHATQHRARFERPIAASTRTTTLGTLSDSRRAALQGVDRRTYASRHQDAQARWTRDLTVPQTVIYQSQPSFGAIDALFLWSMLDSPSYGYHHYNDPSYQAWRREADRLSADNADLRRQLEELDRGIALQTGARNPDYLPEGVDADTIYAPAFVAATRPTLRVCTGRTDGTYFRAASVYDNLLASVDVQVVATEGSTHNLAQMEAAGCDAAFVQRDAYFVYQDSNDDAALSLRRVGQLYDEHAHLFCSTASEVTHLTDLEGRDDIVMYAGTLGSGSNVTWRNLVRADDDLAGVTVVNKDATDASFGAPNHCGLYVGHLNSQHMATISEARGAKEVRMIDIENIDPKTIRDPEGQNVYAAATIAEDTYTSQRGWNDLGVFSDTPTLTVPVDIVVNEAWLHDKMPTDADATAVLEELSNTRQAVVQSLTTSI